MTDYPTLADLCPSTVRMYRLCFLCRAWASATETSSPSIYTSAFLHWPRWAAIVDDRRVLIVYRTQPSPAIPAYSVMQSGFGDILVQPGTYYTHAQMAMHLSFSYRTI